MKPVSLNVALKPVLVFGFICGVYTLHTHSGKGRRVLRILQRSVNVMLPSLACLLLVLRVMGGLYEVLRASREGRDNISSLYLTGLLLGAVYLAGVFSTSGSRFLRRFIRSFNEYCSRFVRENRQFGAVFKLGMLAALVVAVNEVTAVYTAYKTSTRPCVVDRSSTFLWPVIAASCIPPVVYISNHFVSNVFVAGFSLFVCVWRLLMWEASDMVQRLKETEKTTLTEKPEVLERFRLRHAELCDLITQANRSVQHITAAVLGAGVPCFLFVLHGCVYGRLSAGEFLTMALLFVSMVICMAGVMIMGIALHLKMHQPTNLLFTLSVERMVGRGSEVVAAFLSRVQGAPIGFNVYHLFTLDTSTILMVCGTILTYAVVIIQFQPAGSGSSQFNANVHTQAQPSEPDLVTTLPNLSTHFNFTTVDP